MTRNRRICLGFWIGAAALWTVFIWSNSLRAGVDSSNQSARVLLLLRPLLSALGVPGELHHFLVRKAAHFTEFAVLGVLWWKAFFPMKEGRGRREWCALLAAVATAAADETLQRFSEGRACSLRDVGIDSLGAVCGIGLCFLLALLWRMREKKK